MSSFWTPRAIAALLKGRWQGDAPADADATLRGLSIDSRTIQPGQVFLAIKGDRFDGHDFLDAAFARGAAFAIASSSHPSFLVARPSSLLLVPDPLAALHRLASAWRDELGHCNTTVIAVAGSNGKTTTRHLIHHVLTCGGLRGTQSPKSFNNHIGVPLTLLASGISGVGCRVSGQGKDDVTPEHSPHPTPHTPADDFVVVEVGTNHPGEIAALGAIVRPDIAVITSIGAEHLEFFGDLAGVAREEASLLACVRDGGVAFVPRHGDWPEDFEFPVPVGVGLAQFLWQDAVAEAVALPGVHNLSNAAAAAAVARTLGLTDEVIRRGLATVAAVEGRSEVIELGQRVTLLNDSYNANPSSMLAALAMLGEVAGHRRRVMVLGDMLELGDESPRAHADVVTQAVLGGGVVILIGERMTAFDARQTPALREGTMPDGVHLFRTLDASATAAIVELLRPGDAVLLKASRGMRLERLIPAIEARFPREGEPSPSAASPDARRPRTGEPQAPG